jgi:alkylation response protein AidB-like acyl-CoA dehydrogenase
MDFDLSEDQRLLQDSLTKLLADKYKFEDRKRYLKSATGWSQEMWEAYADLGLLGLPFAEEDGGFGAGPVEVMLMAEAMGSAITLEPWLATVVMGGGFIRHGASAAQRAAMRASSQSWGASRAISRTGTGQLRWAAPRRWAE